MSDFTDSQVYGMPLLTADTLRRGGDPRVIGWIREAVVEGDRINRDDPSYERAELGMRYIVGEQRRDPSEDQVKYLPKMTINESRKVVQAHASVLTDLKPVWNYVTDNQQFKPHGQLLDKLIIAWYLRTSADLELGNWVKYAAATGTADLMVEYNPHARFGGDHHIMAKDFRDTLPWRPAPNSRSVQDWQGVIFREEYTVNVLRGMYPEKAALFVPTPDSLLATLMGRFRSAASRLVSPAADTLSGLTNSTYNAKPKSGNVLLYRTFLEDQSRNLTSSPIPMGPPGAVWAYVVPPGGRMYPYKRLILATDNAIISDGPAPFWHGMFPFSRLKLWEVPWQFLGVSLLNDLIPVQDGINDNTNDLRLGIKQWMDPKTVYDRQAVSETFMRLYDSRRPGAKIKTNPTYGDGFKNLDGPNPEVLQLALEFIRHLTDKFSDLSGVANLQALLQLRQMPGSDTIRQYYEAMTPELRAEGRMIETALRDVAEMLKVNTFQWESKAKRIKFLGDAGQTLQDFDLDPNTMVPAMEVGQPGYTPELDADVPRAQRAQFFHGMLTFRVSPGSILAMNASEQKLLYLQLARMSYMDIWSLMEKLEIPNFGQPPMTMLPVVGTPDPQAVLASLTANGGLGDGHFTINPANGQLLELRMPETITERLLSQMQLGIGMAVNPAGRKASAQEPPHMESGKKDQVGAPRESVSESKK
jgi:hypothetical protein